MDVSLTHRCLSLPLPAPFHALKSMGKYPRVRIDNKKKVLSLILSTVTHTVPARAPGGRGPLAVLLTRGSIHTCL